MHKLVSTIVFSLSALGILFAGATIDYSEVSILGCQKGDACGAGNDGVHVCPVLLQVVTAPMVGRPGAAEPARASLRRSSERDVTYATSNPISRHEAYRDNTKRPPSPHPGGRRPARRGIGDCPGSDALFDSGADSGGIGGMPRCRSGFRSRPTGTTRRRRSRRCTRQFAALQGVDVGRGVWSRLSRRLKRRQRRQRYTRPRSIHGGKLPEHPHGARRLFPGCHGG